MQSDRGLFNLIRDCIIQSMLTGRVGTVKQMDDRKTLWFIKTLGEFFRI